MVGQASASAPQKLEGLPFPLQAEESAVPRANTGVASPLFVPNPGLLQVLLPELLALAAQHGKPASSQPPHAEPEGPRRQLEGWPGPAACGAQGWQVRQ